MSETKIFQAPDRAIACPACALIEDEAPVADAGFERLHLH
jgi:hypothetical protein